MGRMEWLFNIRQKAGLKRGGMASRAGITQTSYEKIEDNPVGPRERVFIAAFDASKLSAKDFIEAIRKEVLSVEEAKAAAALEKIRQRKQIVK